MRSASPTSRTRRRSARLGLIVGVLAGSLVFGGGAAWAYWTAAATATGTANTSKVSVAVTGFDTTLKTITNTYTTLKQSGQSFILTNSGQVSGTVTAAIATPSPNNAFAAKVALTVWVKSGTCGTTPGTGAVTGTWATLNNISAGTLAPGASKEFCTLSTVGSGAGMADALTLAVSTGTQTATPQLTATIAPPSTSWGPVSVPASTTLKSSDIFPLDSAYHPASGSPTGTWYALSTTTGAPGTARCLDVFGGYIVSGTSVISYACAVQSNQSWQVATASGLTPKAVTLSPRHASTLNLEATSSTSVTVKTRSPLVGTLNSNQQWYVQATSVGSLQIVSAQNGLCLVLPTDQEPTYMADCSTATATASTKVFRTARS